MNKIEILVEDNENCLYNEQFSIATTNDEQNDNSHFVEYKFEQEDWLDAENKVTALEKSILDCLKKLGKGEINNESELTLLPVCGEEIYINSREKLSNWKYGSLLFEDYFILNFNDFLKKRTENFNKDNKIKNKKVAEELLANLDTLTNLSKTFESVSIKITQNKILDKVNILLKELTQYDEHKKCMELVKDFDNTKKKKDKSAKKNLKKIDKMRLDNLMNKYINELSTLLNTYEKDNLNTTYGFGQAKIVELLGITFMYTAWFVLNHPERYTKRSKLVDVYEIIVAIQRFINSCETYEGRSMYNSANKESPSNSMCKDLQFWLNNLSNIYEFDGFKIYDIAPKLFVYTNYDAYIPCKSIKPRKNQSDLILAIRNNLYHNPQDGLLVILKAPISSGKTFSIVALSSLVRSIREQSKNKSNNIEIIFACNLRSVKNQAANLAYNSDVKFGVGYIRKDKVRVVNHNTCKSDAERELIICSPNVAEILLKQDSERIKKEGGSNKYWLFLDEPTVGADQLGSDSLNKNVAVMMNMPKYTILSSATMPDFEYLEELINYHKVRFPRVHLETVYSGEIQIGCDVKLHNNDMILPHLLCKNKQDLYNVIKRIEKNPFLGRMYTYKVVKQLWNDLSEFTDNVPDLKTMFKDVNNLSSEKIRIEAIKMLKTMSNLIDDEIEQLCSINFVDELKQIDFNNDDDVDKKEKSNITFGEEEDEDNSDVNYDYLGTIQSYRFQSMNLIATSDPIGYSIKHFANLLNKLKEHSIDSASKLIDKYNKEMTSFNKIIEKVKEGVSKYDTSSKNIQQAINSNINDFKNNFSSQRKDVMDVYDNKMSKMETSGKANIDEKASMQLQQLEQTKKPMINLPRWAQINTIEHIKFFAKTNSRKINIKLIRPEYPAEDLPLDSSVPDEVMLLLMCGIGIYSPTNENLDYKYTRFVLDLASKGLLAYLVADSSISYGTNYPIVRLFVTDDFAKQHSVYTLLQLMGRPGRVGHSYKAEVFLEKYAAELLLKFAHDHNHPLGLIESNNIQKTIKNIIEIKDRRELERIIKIEEELKLIQEQKRIEHEQKLEQLKRQEELRKYEEQRQLELQHKIEKEKRLAEEKKKLNGFSVNRSRDSRADNDNCWRKNPSTDNNQNFQSNRQNNGSYISPSNKNLNSENSENSEWKTVDKKKNTRNRW